MNLLLRPYTLSFLKISKLKVTPSFCFPFEIPDDPTAYNMYICKARPTGQDLRLYCAYKNIYKMQCVKVTYCKGP